MSHNIMEFTGTELEYALLERGEKEAFGESFSNSKCDSDYIEGRVAQLLSGRKKIYFLANKNKLVAYVIFDQRIENEQVYGYIYSIYVAPEHRGQGCVDTLLNQVSVSLELGEQRSIYLDVSTENSAAIRAYERNGYKIVQHQMKLQIDK